MRKLRLQRLVILVGGFVGLTLLSPLPSSYNRIPNSARARTISEQTISKNRPNQPKQHAARELTAKLPLAFEANTGRLDSRARFAARGIGYDLFLTATGAVIEFQAVKKEGENTRAAALLASPKASPTSALSFQLRRANRSA